MADKMKEKDVDKYASTKHKGLPNKVQSEETLNEISYKTASRMAIDRCQGKKVSVKTAENQQSYSKKVLYKELKVSFKELKINL